MRRPQTPRRPDTVPRRHSWGLRTQRPSTRSHQPGSPGGSCEVARCAVFIVAWPHLSARVGTFLGVYVSTLYHRSACPRSTEPRRSKDSTITQGQDIQRRFSLEVRAKDAIELRKWCNHECRDQIDHRMTGGLCGAASRGGRPIRCINSPNANTDILKHQNHST